MMKVEGSNTHNHAHWKLTYALLFSCTEKNVSTGSISSFVSVVFTYHDRKITLCLFCDVI